jgi:N6-adenosine-specific RNA methylase IME4
MARCCSKGSELIGSSTARLWILSLPLCAGWPRRTTPWQYETGGALPYPTMPRDEIKAMLVGRIAGEAALLWLWTTNAHLRVAFWVKDRMGTGDWLRGQIEHCLLAIRGKPAFLNGSHTTVIQAARREHSRKAAQLAGGARCLALHSKPAPSCSTSSSN